jgi:hypothetical protein
LFYYLSRLEQLLTWLQKPRSLLVVAVAALVLVLPSLCNRLVLDDHVLALLLRDDPGIAGFGSQLRGSPALPAGPLNLFTFTTGEPEANRALRDEGALLPWWVDEHHLNAFLRPLSSLTHWLDFQLWPGSPWLMHLHSVLWYGALLLVVALVYRRLAVAPPALAALAFLIFALDDAHGATVSWIANRNALVAITLALPALIAHHRFRSQGWRHGAYLGPFWLTAGLLGGESALTVCGYLLAYALFLDRGPLARRLLGLVGYGAVLALWLLAFRLLNLGSHGSGAYSDPIHEPLAFAKSLSFNLTVLFSAQFGGPPADLAFWAEPRIYPALLLLALLTLVAIAWLLVPLLRRDPVYRFWATGTALAALPLASSLPGERLLLGVGVGASPLVAGLLLTAFDAGGGEARKGAGWLRNALLLFLFLVHVVLPPLALPVQARSREFLGAAIDRAEGSIPASADIRDKTVIIVNAPFDIMASYVQVMRESRHRNRPRHLYWLAVANSPLELRRVGERTLRVRPRRGFLRTPLEQHYRADAGSLGRGAVVRLPEMTVTITAVTDDGRPQEADFAFRRALDSPRYLFLVYENGKYKPFDLPAAGRTVKLPAEDFLTTVISETLGVDVAAILGVPR